MRGISVTASLLALAIVAAAAAGCSREEGLSCESTERYGSARGTPPLRVPDDLSVPDETDVLRIPDEAARDTGAPGNGTPCLESPPPFLETTEG